MRRILLATLLSCGLTARVQSANGQPTANAVPVQPEAPFALPLESVTVVATKPSDTAIKSFIETRSAPTYILGRMARWTSRICPQTIGLGEKYAKYVTQRIRDVAAAAGGALNPDLACKPNIEVVFTTSPQELLDNVRKFDPILLGYHHSIHQAYELAKITYPIQAWYTTVSQDIDGSRSVDNGSCGAEGGTSMTVNSAPMATGAGGLASQSSFTTLNLPCAVFVHSNGSRANDGLNSGFFNALIVAEPAKLFDYEVGSLADYITMLALSQPASQDSCQELPSISNLLAPGCASTTSRITDGDLAYLHGLYTLYGGEFLAAQRDHLRYEMKKVLVTDKGG
jgi:hypothetical protein